MLLLGAILSPTIFLTLIADMELWTGAQLHGYADDTSCTSSNASMEEVINSCESNVNNLLNYMAVNKLAANDEKTHILVTRGRMKSLYKEKISFKIGSATVTESESEKLLGIWVSNDLKWSHHLTKLESKLKSKLHTLRQVEQVVPRSLLKKVADGIFISVIRYKLGIFWPIRVEESDPHHTNLEGIKVAFNNMLRFLCGVKTSDRMSEKNAR